MTFFKGMPAAFTFSLLQFKRQKLENIDVQNYDTLKSLIEEHARLDFSDFLPTLFAIFYAINEKFNPACLLIYLVKKPGRAIFFQACLFIPVCSCIRYFRVSPGVYQAFLLSHPCYVRQDKPR